jgi:hypothetical protein
MFIFTGKVVDGSWNELKEVAGRGQVYLVPYSRFSITLFSTPLRGIKNKKSGECFEIRNLK